jgi:hypothetical protein
MVQMLLTLHISPLAMHDASPVARQVTRLPRWNWVLPRRGMWCALPIVVRLVVPIHHTEPTTPSLILPSTTSASMKTTTDLPLVGTLVSSPSNRIRLSRTAEASRAVAAISDVRTFALSRSATALHPDA